MATYGFAVSVSEMYRESVLRSELVGYYGKHVMLPFDNEFETSRLITITNSYSVVSHTGVPHEAKNSESIFAFKSILRRRMS